MLCEEGDLRDLRRQGYAAEDKWDGTRVKIDKKNGKVTLINRHGIDYTHRLPEFVEAAKAIKGDFTIDTEAVYINPTTGEIEFTPCQRRCATQDFAEILWKQRKFPLIAKPFDIMERDGEDLTRRRYLDRKEILAELLKGAPSTFQYTPHTFEIEQKWNEVVKRGDEGLILKDINSAYEYERSYKWMKLKNWKPPEVCDVVGFTPGNNARSPFFGSLVLVDPLTRQFRGCVGTGFNDWELRQIKDLITDAKKVAKPFDIGEPYTALDFKLRVEVTYYKHTVNGVMRFPVFLKIVS